MIHAFPKIFTIGSDYIIDIFKEVVEITEKIDGSQFVFGRIKNEIYMRSKGKQIFPEVPEKMFQLAVDFVQNNSHKIPNNTVYYCEFLNKPKHNVLAYNRIPNNNLILFGVCTTSGHFENKYKELEKHAKQLDIEIIPLIYKGKVKKVEDILILIERESILGEQKVEGIVVKNYKRPFLLGGQPIPLMMGKYVSEKYKEVHNKNWGKEKTTKGKYQIFLDSFRTEARWQKAVQHLQEKGELENAPRDIGKLIKEIPKDIEIEEKENIKNWLWKEFGKDILRKSTARFPEWYKEYLLKKSFNKKIKIKKEA